MTELLTTQSTIVVGKKEMSVFREIIKFAGVKGTVRVYTENGNLYISTYSLKYSQLVFYRNILVQNYEGSLDIYFPIPTIKKIQHRDILQFSPQGLTIDAFKYGTEPTSFNSFPEVTENETYPHIDICRVLQEVGVVRAKEEVRAALRTVNLNENKITATDGYVLLQQTIDVHFPNINIPGVEVLGKMFTENVTMFYNNKYIKFQENGKEIIIRLFEGSYPDLSRVLNAVRDVHGRMYNLPRWEEKISSMNKNKIEMIMFDFNTDFVHLSAKEENFQVDLDLDYTGDSIKFGFNPVNLGKGIKFMSNCKTVDVHMHSPNEPILITSDNRVALIAPMRLK